MMRMNKKRPAKAQLQSDGSLFDGRDDQDHYRATSHISANRSGNDDPFLTESEKAIVIHAASPDGEPNVSFAP